MILASNSPRRKEILESLGYSFNIIPSHIDENIPLEGKDLVLALAYQKAMDIFKQYPLELVIGADTIVSKDHEVYGKPKDEEDCFRILSELSGKTHQVITGVAILSPKGEKIFYEEANVSFRNLSEEEIRAYAKTKEPYDKAGGYAIQGEAHNFVEKFEGDYYTIVGLPKEKVREEIKKFL